jgi:hypothetical protein
VINGPHFRERLLGAAVGVSGGTHDETERRHPLAQRGIATGIAQRGHVQRGEREQRDRQPGDSNQDEE